jgi:hypothetical protein
VREGVAMNVHRVEAVVGRDGSLLLEDLPFREGDAVEIIILERSRKPEADDRYPLRGTPIEYVDPTEPVAEEDWDVLR